MAFEQFKINLMSLKVHEATQDKFQLYIRYIRRLYQIVESRNQFKMRKDRALRTAFHHWKVAH